MNRPTPIKPDNFFLLLFKAISQRRVPLVLRIVSHTLLLVILALLIHAWVMGLQFKHAMQQHADALGRSLITQTAASATELLAANDILSLNVLLNNLVENPLVAHATLHSVDNRVLAEAGSEPARSLLDDNQGLYATPIAFQEVIAGRLTIRLDMQNFQQPMTISLQNMALLSLILLALTLALSLRLGRRISTPLAQLRLWLRDPDFPAPGAARHDEIGDLARQLQARLAPEPVAPAVADEDDEPTFDADTTPDDDPPAAAALATPAQTAVLAVRLTGADGRNGGREVQGRTLRRFQALLERIAGLYQAQLQPLKDDTSLLLFHGHGAPSEHLAQALCCSELLRAQGDALQDDPDDQEPLVLQLGLAQGEALVGLSRAQLLLSEQAQIALELSQHSRNLLLLERRLADDPALRQHACIRRVARPDDACCLERLLPPYPALLERQLAQLQGARDRA